MHRRVSRGNTARFTASFTLLSTLAASLVTTPSAVASQRAPTGELSPPPAGCERWSSDPAIGSEAPEDCLKSFNLLLRRTAKIAEKTTNKIASDETVVETYSGGRTQRSYPDFRVQPGWSVAWQSEGASFVAKIHRAGSNGQRGTLVANVDEKGEGEKAFDAGGRYFLEIDAERAWSVEILQHESSYSYDYDLSVAYLIENPFEHAIEFKYDNGSGQIETTILQGGTRRRILVTALVTGFESPQPNSVLMHEMSRPQILSIVSMDPTAVDRRAQAGAVMAERDEKLKRTQAQEEHARKSRERAAMNEFSQTSRRANAEAAEEATRLDEEEVSASRARSKKRTALYASLGAGIMVAGFGGGAALIGIGASRLPRAEQELDDFQAQLDALQKLPTNFQVTELGRLEEQVASNKRLVQFGVITAAIGVVGGATFFTLAGIESGKRKRLLDDKDTAKRNRPRFQFTQLSPAWNRQGGSIVVGGRF